MTVLRSGSQQSRPSLCGASPEFSSEVASKNLPREHRGARNDAGAVPDQSASIGGLRYSMKQLATDFLRSSSIGKSLSRLRALRPSFIIECIVLLSAFAVSAVAAPEPQSNASLDKPGNPAVIAETADPRLPTDVPPRITIRYFAQDPSGLQRAIELSRGLSEQGLRVVDLVEAATRVTNNTVGYFYAEDQLGATIATRGLGPEWKTVQRRLAAREPLPRPGAIELTVKGQ